MKADFEEKFKKILEEDLKGLDIDSDQVEIKHVGYKSTPMSALPVELEEYTIRMRVVGVDDEIRDVDDVDVDNWLRSHKFIYAMMSKSVRTDYEQSDMMTFDVGTIESIAMKIRDAFKDFQGNET